MEHPFFPMNTTRPEALRWLTIAEKLLSARDLMGSKAFATRARDADPTLSPADQILAVVDTLLAGDLRIGNNNLQDLYAILRLTQQQGRDADLIDRQYRSLALILNPQKNSFPFAEQAFALVLDAWSVLSNPSRKLMYDKELAFYLQPQPPPLPQQHPPPPTDMFGNPIPAMHHNIFAGVSSSSGVSYQSQPQGVTYPPQPQPQPQPHSTVHFSQVHVHSNSLVEPVVGESVRVPPNLMNFSPAPPPAPNPNIVFGTGLGSKPGIESLNKQPQETPYSHFQGNVAAATGPPPETSQSQMSNHQEQPQTNYSHVGDGSTINHNVSVNVNENVQEEDPSMEEEDIERMEAEEDEDEEIDTPADELGDDPSPFWTACPYCYYMYEYPRAYVDCTLRCSNCKMAFQAVVIPSPPDGQDGYFCCWGFLPMGFSMEHWEKNKANASRWTPFSPMFNLPHGWGNNPKRQPGSRKTEPRIYVDDDEALVELSDSSESDDADWRNTQKRKKKKRGSYLRGRGAIGAPTRSSKRGQTDKGKTVEAQDGLAPKEGVETISPNKTTGIDANNKGPAVVTARKQPARAAKNFGKLDLNVECSNEAEEAAPRVNEENGHGHGGDDNIEGIGFFEGLDEFLSSLPILNVVGDEKVVKAA